MYSNNQPYGPQPQYQMSYNTSASGYGAQHMPMQYAQPIYLSNNPISYSVIPFSGDSFNAEESIYTFLEQVRFVDAFKAATSDLKKIEAVGAYLRDPALTWFHEEDWSTTKYGSDGEEGTFVFRFIAKFLDNNAKFNLKMIFSERVQEHEEDVMIYMKEKTKLYKKFAKVDYSSESLLVADIVRGLNHVSRRGLKGAPQSLNDLESQLRQAEWVTKEEMKQSIPTLVQILNQGDNNSNNALMSHNPLNSGAYQAYGHNGLLYSGRAYTMSPSGMDPMRMIGDMNSMNFSQLNNLRQHLMVQAQQKSNSQQFSINNTSTTKDQSDTIKDLTKKMEKLMDELEKSKSANNAVHTNYSRNMNTRETTPSYSNSPYQPVCRNCSTSGHMQKYCREPCGGCGDTTHVIGGCKNPRQANRQDFQVGRRQ